MQPEAVLLLVGVVFGTAVIIMLAVALRRLSVQDPSAVEGRFDELQRSQERTERAIGGEIARNREESATSSKQLREEVGRTLAALTQSNEEKLERVRGTLEERLTVLQFDNARKLEEIRVTVDEKLQGTLEAKLGESFRLVSERLEQVHKGLGEMQTLASGVGDLKKVLANVKTRGIWGEVQLQQLLDQILTADQYVVNVATREGSDERVEFAIRMPGRGATERDAVLLPIDAKFPIEDYERLVEASERGDPDAVEAATRQLENRVKTFARDIRDKYLNPPRTTEFGILFLPTEGLYAEVVRRAGLLDHLQHDLRVLVCGPTTLWALLNSLQMGFRTLAIERRSSEVWTLLGAVKTEFAKFGDALDAVQKKLTEATDKIDAARKGTRKIERKLKDVQELPAVDAAPLLEAAAVEPDEGDQDPT